MKRIIILLVVIFSLSLAFVSCQSDSKNNDDSDNTGDDMDTDGGSKSCEKVLLPTLDPPDLSQGPSVVELDENGTFVVNGEKFFPYGFYRVPETEALMQEFTDAGFNTILFDGGCCTGDNLENHLEQIEWLAQFDVMGVGRAFKPVDQIYSEETSTLQDWLEQRNEVGNMLYWYTYDEPALHSVDKQEAQDYHDTLSTLDPDHPHAHVAATLENYDEYIDYTDLLMIDPYPAPAYPLSYVAEAYREAVAASGGEKRVLGVPQAFDWYVHNEVAPENHIWRPTVSEMRNMHYQYAVLGANGMIAWNYNKVYAEPERWAGLVEVAAEITELMPLLVEPNSDLEITATPDVYYVSHALKELDGVFYLMVVSTWLNDVTVTYDLSALGDDLCALHYFTEEPVDVVDGKVTLNITREGDAVIQIITQ